MSNRILQALKELTAEVEYLKEQNNTLKTRVITCNKQKNLYRDGCIEWKNKAKASQVRLRELEDLLDNVSFESLEMKKAKEIYTACSELEMNETA